MQWQREALDSDLDGFSACASDEDNDVVMQSEAEQQSNAGEVQPAEGEVQTPRKVKPENAAGHGANSPCCVTPLAKFGWQSPEHWGHKSTTTVLKQADEQHECWWWYKYIANSSLGRALAAALAASPREWRVASGCTGKFSEAWSYEVNRCAHTNSSGARCH